MEQIAENTADSLTESVKEVNQFTQYFQGKIWILASNWSLS